MQEYVLVKFSAFCFFALFAALLTPIFQETKQKCVIWVPFFKTNDSTTRYDMT